MVETVAGEPELVSKVDDGCWGQWRLQRQRLGKLQEL